MSSLLCDLLERKRARRKELAALPVGEKLHLLEEMIADTRAIVASRPPKAASPVRWREADSALSNSTVRDQRP